MVVAPRRSDDRGSHLLLRDADAQWPSAFGARTVFAKRAVSEDEPFGADWEPLDPVDAEEVWRAALGSGAPESPHAALEEAARWWGVTLAPFDVGAPHPAETILVVGPSAVAALVDAFSRGADLDWTEQVTVIATPPAHRQLAALAGALLNTTKASTISTALDASAPPGARLVLSSDAHPEDALAARRFVQ